MLLAETQYRHQVAAEIQPFRGLLLGLFFMTVGMGIDIELAYNAFATIALLFLALLLLKGIILLALARATGMQTADAVNLGALLSQGGEFAFVLFGAGLAVGVLPQAETQLLILVVAFTMMATPYLALLGRKLSQRVERASVDEIEDSSADLDAMENHVVIAGFGRVGHAVARSLTAAGTPFVAIDLNPHSITQALKEGLKVYYGDATRPEILAAVQIDRAQAIVVALDSAKASLQLVALCKYIFPELKVYARAKSEAHAKELEEAGAHTAVPELVLTGHRLAESILGAGPGLDLGPAER